MVKDAPPRNMLHPRLLMVHFVLLSNTLLLYALQLFCFFVDPGPVELHGDMGEDIAMDVADSGQEIKIQRTKVGDTEYFKCPESDCTEISTYKNKIVRHYSVSHSGAMYPCDYLSLIHI